ncbi:MAG: nitroreductase family protein [Candidatus Hydrogenedentes bacterium]|nr:nitroreductase family protein [Candidatus Hydrogenedentota bacterium]
MDALETLRTRRSVRTFLDKPVPKDLLETVIDCGRLAASAINIQPWEFVVVTDNPMRQRIADTTDHGKHIAQAAACVAVFCKDGKYYLEDGSAATQNILLAARALGLGSCWIAADKKAYADTLRTMLGVPFGYKAVSLIAIGYTEEDPHPAKRPLKELLHWEHF